MMSTAEAETEKWSPRRADERSTSELSIELRIRSLPGEELTISAESRARLDAASARASSAWSHGAQAVDEVGPLRGVEGQACPVWSDDEDRRRCVFLLREDLKTIVCVDSEVLDSHHRNGRLGRERRELAAVGGGDDLRESRDDGVVPAHVTNPPARTDGEMSSIAERHVPRDTVDRRSRSDPPDDPVAEREDGPVLGCTDLGEIRPHLAERLVPRESADVHPRHSIPTNACDAIASRTRRHVELGATVLGGR